MGAIHQRVEAVSLQEVATAPLILEVEPADPPQRHASTAVYDRWHVRRSFTSAGDAHVGTTIEVPNVSGAAARSQAEAWEAGISAHVVSLQHIIELRNGERAPTPPPDAARVLFLFTTGFDSHPDYGLFGDVALGLEHLPALESLLREREAAAKPRRRSFWARLFGR